MVWSPRAASLAAATVTSSLLSPALRVGLAGVSFTPGGTPSKESLTSWSKFLPRLMPTWTVLLSPWLTLVEPGSFSSNARSGTAPTASLAFSPAVLAAFGVAAPGPPGLVVSPHPRTPARATGTRILHKVFIVALLGKGRGRLGPANSTQV